MCAAPNSTKTQKSTDVSSTPSTATKPVPKWLKMKQQNLSSAGRTAKPIAKKSSGSAQQKPSEGTREEKRARWAKKAVPKQKPVAPRRENAFEYISACCSLPARKPKAGQKEAVKDPESGKVKDKPKGLGKWRCSGCGKVAKVTPRKPQPKIDAKALQAAVAAAPNAEARNATIDSAVAGTFAGSCPDIIYPGKLQTPVLLEVPIASA